MSKYHELKNVAHIVIHWDGHFEIIFRLISLKMWCKKLQIVLKSHLHLSTLKNGAQKLAKFQTILGIISTFINSKCGAQC